MKFRIEFERETVITERVTRVIEADNQEHADELADGMASEFDNSCPDDASSIGGADCQSWRSTRVSPAGPLDIVDVD
jgi:hypothetical protein